MFTSVQRVINLTNAHTTVLRTTPERAMAFVIGALKSLPKLKDVLAHTKGGKKMTSPIDCQLACNIVEDLKRKVHSLEQIISDKNDEIQALKKGNPTWLKPTLVKEGK